LKQVDRGTIKRAGAVANSRNGEDDPLQPEDIVRVDTSLVVLDVGVTDASGSRYITGLTKDDFLVIEDDQPQEITTFTLGDDAVRLPRSVVLIIDTSMSQMAYFEASLEAAKKLVSQLAPTDRMAIVSADVKLIVAFTKDKGRLKSALDSLKKLTKNGVFGGSTQFSTLLATLRELIDSGKTRPIIIFQTDGDEAITLDLRLLSRSPAKPEAADQRISIRPYSLDDIYAELERSRVKVYTIIPGERLIGIASDELLKRGRKMLSEQARIWNERYNVFGPRAELPQPGSEASIRFSIEMFVSCQVAAARVADLTGGWTEFMERPERAGEIYRRILSDINNRYIIGYYPTKKTRNGELRKIRIEVRGHSDYVLNGRRSYYATPR
jgi:VWFA-related protein